MSKDTKKGRVLGIDYGSRRVGISISDPTWTIAKGLTVIENNSDLIEKIKEICEKNGVEKIVVGFPLRLSGKLSSKTEEVDKFIKKLKNRINIDIIKWDERLTTVMAQRSKIEMGLKKKKRMNKSLNDIISASLILQSYLDYVKNSFEVK